jgi:hypothetical protein
MDEFRLIISIWRNNLRIVQRKFLFRFSDRPHVTLSGNFGCQRCLILGCTLGHFLVSTNIYFANLLCWWRLCVQNN